MKKIVDEIIRRILNGERNLEKIKKQIAREYKLNIIPKNTEILKRFPKSKMTDEIFQMLKRKPMRTSSGVTPIAVMIRPQGSCAWKCAYCPSSKIAPKSYTGYEPSSRRARMENFDPYRQVKTRLNQFKINGHPTDKCEVIIMGGTFLAMPLKYQRWFVKNIYDALNGVTSRNIRHAKKINETAKNKVVGLTIETRPDVCKKLQLDRVLEFGATRIELGVQNPDDEIYKKTKRGHSVQDVVDATNLAKNAALKVVYHLMPGLFGSNKRKDIEMVKKIFSDERFKPDMLKIYPTLVMPGTELYNYMQRGIYKPLKSDDAIEIISEWYRYIPEYVRVMRIQRDIPANLIHDGNKKGNLRELVEREVENKKINPREIRYREIGLNKGKITKPVMKRLDYKASGADEVFLSFVDEVNGYLIGFIRLRIPNESYRKEIDSKCALIRELHIYGAEAKISKKGSVQHKGFGAKLLKEAERIAKEEFNRKRIVIISGVGVREYYYKFGYKADGVYVSKKL